LNRIKVPKILKPFLDSSLESYFIDYHTDICDLVNIYLHEAAFGFKVIEPSLSYLNTGDSIIEVGAGHGVLSRLLAAKGFNVTAYEPSQREFSFMAELRNAIDLAWIDRRAEPHWISEPFGVTPARTNGRARLVFGISVLEHVSPFEPLLTAAYAAIEPGGTALFTFPNYRWPYEPHFHIATLWSKNLTYRVLAKKISDHKPLANSYDSQELWNNLSWPVPSRIKSAMKSNEIPYEFSRSAFHLYVNRLRDSEFVVRKGTAFRFLRLISGIVSGLGHLFRPSSLPILELRIRRCDRRQ
jgi:2-polyprenyl-3-methyl-5-hydroxy-6-metoxy-1,4-benzoquinol methylase